MTEVNNVTCYNNSSVGQYYCRCFAERCYDSAAERLDLAASDDCFMEECFKPKLFTEEQVIFCTAVYSIIFILGVSGNIVTTCVLLRHPDLKSTSTSAYLANLAIADTITILIGLPHEIYTLWKEYPYELPEWMCVFRVVALETTYYSSVLTIIAFSIERYLAVCHVLLLVKLNLRLNRILYTLAAIWCIAILSAFPFGFVYEANYYFKKRPWEESGGGPLTASRVCQLSLYFHDEPPVSSMEWPISALYHVSAIVFFFIPLVLLAILYGLIAGRILRSTKFRKSEASGQQHVDDENEDCYCVVDEDNPTRIFPKSLTNEDLEKTQHISKTSEVDTRNQRVFAMLVSLVVGFFVCYAPHQIQRLLSVNVENLSEDVDFYLFVISGILFYLSGTINPILYNLISSRYRKAFGEVISCRLKSDPSKPFGKPRLLHSDRNTRAAEQMNGEKMELLVTHKPVVPASSDRNSVPGTTSHQRQ